LPFARVRADALRQESPNRESSNRESSNRESSNPTPFHAASRPPAAATDFPEATERAALRAPKPPDCSPTAVAPQAVEDPAPALALPVLTSGAHPAALSELPWSELPWTNATPPATAHAGLLFVLNALTRLGLPDWLARHPHSMLPLRLLYDLGQRLRLPADDPQSRWLAEACAELDLAGASLAEPSLDRALAGWRQTLRRACRINAGIALADLARRPGRILITATHLDVWLDPGAVDLRIRRAGLDLDPGWLPWLARVVRFHYRDPQHTGGDHA
jgi:hypothetical protein